MSIYERTKEVPASIDIFQRLFLPNQAAGSLVSFLRAGPARSRNGVGAASASFTGVVCFSLAFVGCGNNTTPLYRFSILRD